MNIIISSALITWVILMVGVIIGFKTEKLCKFYELCYEKRHMFVAFTLGWLFVGGKFVPILLLSFYIFIELWGAWVIEK